MLRRARGRVRAGPLRDQPAQGTAGGSRRQRRSWRRWQSAARVVVGCSAVPAEACSGASLPVQARCETFNGQEVRNLARLAELVDGCQDKYMRFGLEGGKLVILDRCACSGTPYIPT